MDIGIRADERLLEGISLIKAKGLSASVGYLPTRGLDDRHAGTDVPLVAGVMREHPFVASRGDQTTLVGDRTHRLQLHVRLEPFQQSLPGFCAADAKSAGVDIRSR